MVSDSEQHWNTFKLFQWNKRIPLKGWRPLCEPNSSSFAFLCNSNSLSFGFVQPKESEKLLMSRQFLFQAWELVVQILWAIVYFFSLCSAVSWRRIACHFGKWLFLCVNIRIWPWHFWSFAGLWVCILTLFKNKKKLKKTLKHWELQSEHETQPHRIYRVRKSPCNLRNTRAFEKVVVGFASLHPVSSAQLQNRRQMKLGF